MTIAKAYLGVLGQLLLNSLAKLLSFRLNFLLCILPWTFSINTSPRSEDGTEFSSWYLSSGGSA
jgi:hypothetical protein